MAWIGLGKPTIRGAVLEPSGESPDIAVVARPSWLLVGMVIASTAALLATTDEQRVSYGYPFETATDGPPAQLSTSAPSAKFAIKVTVNALGAGDGDTSKSVRLTVRGKIAPNPAPAELGSFVNVQLSGRETAGAEPLSVLTEFDFGQPLAFSGGCERPGGAPPCTAQATLELSRDDAGAHGGVLNVTWNATFDGTVGTTAKVDAPASPPPWTIEVTPL